MSSVKVRNMIVGEGMPKICAPIAEMTKERIIESAEQIKTMPVDLVEWRADWYKDVMTDEKRPDTEKVVEVLKDLRETLGEIPLLVTLRTAGEGGERTVGAEAYVAFYQNVISSGYADLIDVELYAGAGDMDDMSKAKQPGQNETTLFDAVRVILEYAHTHDVKVIVSNHDFDKTPTKEEIIIRLRKMQELGADIAKIAVMPGNKKDVLTLLAATEEMNCHYRETPVAAIAMGKEGVLSRLCGEVFGSAITFGTAGRISAPGQIDVRNLKEILENLHKNL